MILSLLCRLLQTIIKLPPTRTLEVDEKQLVWKFRFSLMSEKKALTKFVRSVDWSDNQVSKRNLYVQVLLLFCAVIFGLPLLSDIHIKVYCKSAFGLFDVTFFIMPKFSITYWKESSVIFGVVNTALSESKM